MNLVLGLIISFLFIMCLILECGGFVRWFFSIIFLLGIFGLTFLIFTAGILLTPLFIAGVVINILFCVIFLPILTSGDKKKNDRRS